MGCQAVGYILHWSQEYLFWPMTVQSSATLENVVRQATIEKLEAKLCTLTAVSATRHRRDYCLHADKTGSVTWHCSRLCRSQIDCSSTTFQLSPQHIHFPTKLLFILCVRVENSGLNLLPCQYDGPVHCCLPTLLNANIFFKWRGKNGIVLMRVNFNSPTYNLPTLVW